MGSNPAEFPQDLGPLPFRLPETMRSTRLVQLRMLYDGQFD